MRRIIIAISIAILATAMSRAQEYREVNDLPYSLAEDTYARARCTLDVYYSPELKDRPVVVWFHGGGLTGGSKFIPEELKNDSLVIVAVNYRLLPQASIDDIIDDAAAAVAWTFNNIEDYGGSPDKIFLAGHSAGGYLISMVGLDKKWLQKYGIDADRVAALVPYSGQVLTHFALREQKGISPLQPVVDEYAPMHYVRKDAPPYIIISGDRNQELYGRYEENAYMWRLFQLVGHPDVELYELDGYNHGDMAVPAHHILLSTIRRLTLPSK